MTADKADGHTGSSDAADVPAPLDLTFGQLHATNVTRCRRWHPGFPGEDAWTGADWSNAMQGESGEAGNVVKKLRRIETGTAGQEGEADREPLILKLADEIADTIIYADLLAAFYGINVADAVVRKFNAVSVRQGFPERLSAPAPGDGHVGAGAGPDNYWTATIPDHEGHPPPAPAPGGETP